jgi:hypothetical protein
MAPIGTRTYDSTRALADAMPSLSTIEAAVSGAEQAGDFGRTFESCLVGPTSLVSCFG